MRIGRAVKVTAFFTFIAGSAPGTRGADDGAWDALDKAEKSLHGPEAELRICNAALDACREGVADRRASDLAAARQALDAAEKAVTAAHTEAGLDAARDQLKAARSARDGKVESLVAAFPAFRAARERRAGLTKRIEEMTGRLATLSAEELLELARLRMEEREVSRQIDGSLRALWSRGEVAAEYKAADEAYKAFGTLSAKADALKQANERVKVARAALADATAALPLDGTAGATLLARRTALEARIAEFKAKIADLEKTLVGAGKTVSVTVKAFDRRTQKEEDRKVSLWLPPNHEYIRGIIVAHPMIGGLATSRPMRLVAARDGLGAMVYENFDGKESLARIDALFEKLAEASGHPELRGAPVLVGGLSASVLGTRNVACAVPARVFGVVHVAGGNMQEMPDGGRGMVQVPFLAQNGEFEWCGPAGGGHSSGKAGIRPEYGQQTQWVMIREQMLRLWRNKHEHRMCLVVVPNADHGAWDVGLTALFVRKAVQYRLPREKRDGSAPAVCVPLPANKGWLSDADLDHPKHEPAPYDSYAGDKNNAFWHFDEEMARAVVGYHKNRFILPDPTKASPVPADWPSGNQ
jgi:hypothetical protein